MKKGGRVPSTPIHSNDKTRLDDAIESLVMYMALSGGAASILRQERRMNEKLAFRMQVEMAFARNVLSNLLKVPIAEYQRMLDEVMASPKYEEEVKKYADSLVPPRPLIITPDEFARELSAAARDGRLVPDTRKLRG